MRSYKHKQKIIATLKEIPRIIDWSISNKEWTNSIKEALCNLGKNEKFLVSSSGEYAENREWLYDLVWFSWDDDEKQHLTNVDLVLECEWRNNATKDNYRWQLQYDFEKLLQARADYRVMIFETVSVEEKNRIIFDFKNGIKLYKGSQSGDAYLFVVYVNDHESRFHFESFTFKHDE